MVVPVNLELSHSGFLNQDMPGEFADLGLRWRVFVELLVLVEVVYIVAHSEELLVVVRAGQQQRSHSHDVVLWQAGVVRGASL